MFIKLTAIAEDNSLGPIFLNMNQTLYFTDSKNGEYTMLALQEQSASKNEPMKFMKIKETPERIMALIASAK